MTTLIVPGSVERVNRGYPVNRIFQQRPSAAHADHRAKAREQRTRKLLGVAAATLGWVGLVVLYLAILAGMRPSRLAVDFGVCIVLTQLGRVLSRSMSRPETQEGQEPGAGSGHTRQSPCSYFV